LSASNPQTKPTITISNMPHVFETFCIWDDDFTKSLHKTAKGAAKAAWKYCRENGLDMPNPDWWIEHPGYGEQNCYNMMVRSEGLNWDPEEEFVVFMTSAASIIRLDDGDGNYIQIYDDLRYPHGPPPPSLPDAATNAAMKRQPCDDEPCNSEDAEPKKTTTPMKKVLRKAKSFFTRKTRKK